jgi:hypothetical protein
MKKTIEIFPKNKDVNTNLLSKLQLKIRKDEVKIKHKKTKICTKCGNELPISEFYPKYFSYPKGYKGKKKIQRYDCACKDCRLRAAGIIEIGRVRFSMKIAKKGFRRCSICKEIKPLSEYSKNKGQYLGISNNCLSCSSKLISEYQKKTRENISDFYIRQYALWNYKIKVKTKAQYEKYRKEIEEKRKPKHFIDGLGFVEIREFARYIEEKYKIPITTTEKRINCGELDENCKIPEYKYRQLKSGTNKGNIKITDLVTKKEFIFFNTTEAEKMFNNTTIIRRIRDGKPTRITSLSKYKNPCRIERI